MTDRIINPHTGDPVLGVGDYVESKPGAGQPLIRGEVVGIERGEVLIQSESGTVRRRSLQNIYLIDPPTSNPNRKEGTTRNPHFDYEPAPGTLNVVVSTEHDPPVLLGTYLGSVEDAVVYFDSGPDEEHHSAPADCVRIVGITV